MSDNQNTNQEYSASENESGNKHREEARQWLDYAEGDAAAAHHLFEGFFHPRKLEIICYHCSQAAEKAVKAVWYR